MSVDRKSRILGALLGVHAGDSLGATVEFFSWDKIRAQYPSGVRDIVGGGHFNWPAGHATDDTDLTRAVLLAYRDAEAARRAGPEPPPDVVTLAARHMVDWYDGRWPGRTPGTPPCDVGGATRTGVVAFKRTGDAARSGAGEGRAGNGSLMRCIPTALFQADPRRRAAESVAVSAITHNDAHCTLACVAYNAAVRALVDAQPPDAACRAATDAIAAFLADDQRGSVGNPKLAAQHVVAAIDAGRSLVRIADLAAHGPAAAAHGPKAIPFKAAGYVLESLTLAVAALMDPRPLEHVLVDVVRIGNDTDTNGAIAGGLLGARDGVDAIPLRWRQKLQFAHEFEEVVEYMLSG